MKKLCLITILLSLVSSCGVRGVSYGDVDKEVIMKGMEKCLPDGTLRINWDNNGFNIRCAKN